MSVLKLLAKHHNEWVDLAKNFGAGSYAEDVVQEMYLRLHKYVYDPERIMYKGEVNKYFVFVTLRNMVRSLQGKKEVVVYTELYEDDNLKEDAPDREGADAFEHMIDRIWDVVGNQHWYHKKLFEIYHTTGMSMRDIEKETNISLFSIFDSLRNTKEYVRKELENEYREFTKKYGDNY